MSSQLHSPILKLKNRLQPINNVQNLTISWNAIRNVLKVAFLNFTLA